AIEQCLPAVALEGVDQLENNGHENEGLRAGRRPVAGCWWDGERFYVAVWFSGGLVACRSERLARQPLAARTKQKTRQRPANQSPNCTYGLRKLHVSTSAMMTSAVERGAWARIRPSASMWAEMPPFAAITSGKRVSTARKTPHAKCKSSPLDPQYQAS